MVGSGFSAVLGFWVDWFGWLAVGFSFVWVGIIYCSCDLAWCFAVNLARFSEG